METPGDPRALSASQLKYLACFFMVIDHIGMLFEPMSAFAGPDSLLFYAFRYLGRIAFPVFAYFAAEGCRRTSNYRRYLLRLGIFGLVTHLVALLATGGENGSVIATFFLSALAVWLYRQLRERSLSPAVALLPSVALALLGALTRVDYGWLGVVLVVALYLCGESRNRKLLVLGAFMAFHYLVQQPLESLLTYGPGMTAPALLHWYGGFLLPFGLLCTFFALLSLPLLRGYRGERGRGNRWFFYWFYPIHLAALYGLSLLVP